jgi:hypothetical protein
MNERTEVDVDDEDFFFIMLILKLIAVWFAGNNCRIRTRKSVLL